MDRRGDYLINNNHDNGIPAEVAALLSETFEDATSSSMSTDEPSTSDVTTPPAGGSCDVIGEKSPGEMEEAPIQREKWAHKMDFVLSVAGGFVGLGNVWRFPYLCYKNGGGAFLIPYAIFLLIGGIPIFFLEVSLGQYMSEGGVTSWRLVPIGTGIGYASMVIVALLNIYYIVILAWAIFYLFQSFTAELPWAKCGHEWNTACCVDTYSVSAANATTTAATTTLASLATTAAASVQCNGSKTSPEIEYWERRVLGLSTGLDDVGGIRWELAGCLALAWVICYFCIWKGVKSTGKVVYFTATFPFLMLIVFLIRGVTLPGAIDGIRFYLTPDTTRLADPQVWIDAGTQIFFSFAICLGALVSLGSYNKFHNNCFRDCVILSMVNSGTSFISGFAIFSVLGFMAREQGVEVKDVASSGPGLAFIAYPKAITLMPGSTVWAILFFIMLLLLGLDSQFVETEGFITSIVDLFPRKLRKGYNREIFIACTCGLSFLVGLSMVTNGGMYVFQLFDYYAASGVCLLWVAFFEAGTIAWLYGGERMWQNVTRMIRYRPWPIIKYVWIFGTPVLTTATFIYSMVKFQRLVYNKTYVYPAWGEAIGWTLALSSMLVIPGYAIYAFVVAEGTFHERWVKLTTPNLRRSHEDFDTEHGERLPALERIFGCDTNDRWRAYRSSKKSGCALGDHVVATKSVMEMKGGEEGVMGGCDEGGSDPPSYDVAVESPWTSPDFAADTPM